LRRAPSAAQPASNPPLTPELPGHNDPWPAQQPRRLPPQ